MSKFRFERKRNSEENGIRNLAKSAGDTKRVKKTFQMCQKPESSTVTALQQFWKKQNSFILASIHLDGRFRTTVRIVHPSKLLFRKFYSIRVGKQIFQIDIRYQNLKVIGSGSYGVVCSADDVVFKFSSIGNLFRSLSAKLLSKRQEISSRILSMQKEFWQMCFVHD